MLQFFIKLLFVLLFNIVQYCTVLVYIVIEIQYQSILITILFCYCSVLYCILFSIAQYCTILFGGRCNIEDGKEPAIMRMEAGSKGDLWIRQDGPNAP